MQNIPYSTLGTVALSKKLADTLTSIEENYTNYELRYDLVLTALLIARQLDYKCGFRFDPDEPDWPVIAIVLPNLGENNEESQISWHMPPSNIKYDGIPNQNSIVTEMYVKKINEAL